MTSLATVGSVSSPTYDCPTSESITSYLRGIGKATLLNSAQEVDLARRIEVGVLARERLCREQDMAPDLRRDLQTLINDGSRAQRHLLEANLRLVVSIAKRYAGLGLPLLDLIQEGNLGLIRAMQGFDYTRGYRFSTYATWSIRQAIARATAEQTRTIRLPIHLVEMLNKIRRSRGELVQELGREPTLEEIADVLGASPRKLHALLQYDRQPLSLDQPIGDGDTMTLCDLVTDSAPGPDDLSSAPPLRQQLEDLLTGLSEREAGVIKLRCGLADGTAHSLEHVSELYGRSRERVRQLEVRGLAKLRRAIDTASLREYLS